MSECVHSGDVGVYEALELRDGGSDYLGKGVLKVGPFVCLISESDYIIRMSRYII